MLKRNIKAGLLIALLFPLFILAESTPQKNSEVKIEKIEGTGLNIVTLSPKAVERLGIKTTEVRQEPKDPDEEEHGDGRGILKQKVIVPYSSILYDANGYTWIYTTSKPLSYVRYRVHIDDIEDDYVALSDGPPIGTKIVAIGVAELYGAETGIGK